MVMICTPEKWPFICHSHFGGRPDVHYDAEFTSRWHATHILQPSDVHKAGFVRTTCTTAEIDDALY